MSELYYYEISNDAILITDIKIRNSSLFNKHISLSNIKYIDFEHHMIHILDQRMILYKMYKIAINLKHKCFCNFIISGSDHWGQYCITLNTKIFKNKFITLELWRCNNIYNNVLIFIL